MKENNQKNIIYHYDNKMKTNKKEYDNEFASEYDFDENRQLDLQKIQDKNASKIVKRKSKSKKN